MSKSIHEQAHEEHARWQSDLETWVADIDQWKNQLKAAIGDLGTIGDSMDDALSALESHADSIWQHQQRTRAHEGVVSQEAREGSGETDPAWAATHAEESSLHGRLGDAHERIKHHQHAVVAEVKRLLGKALEAM